MGLAFVRKKKGPIHCCIDFCNFEKAYPKDELPLLNKGILVDTIIGHSIFYFMDGFSSYNQIRMDPSDAEKTAFWTLMAIFFKHACCSNAGATNRPSWLSSSMICFMIASNIMLMTLLWSPDKVVTTLMTWGKSSWVAGCIIYGWIPWNVPLVFCLENSCGSLYIEKEWALTL